MRIGIISDTHGSMSAIRQAVISMPPVDQWLHAGDYSQDAAFLAQITGLPVTAVKGNCDGQATAKLDEFLELSGKKIWLTHGHRYGAEQRVDELIWWAQRYQVNIVVFGHTHIALIEERENIIVINPGSVTRPKGGGATLAVVEIDKQGLIKAQIIAVKRS